MLVSIGVITCSLISLYVTQCKGPPKLDTGPILASGQFVAEATLELIGNKGELVVVAMDSDYTGIQLKGFKRALKRQRAAKLAAVEYIKADQLTQTIQGAGLSAERFQRLLDTHSKAAAIVLLVGPPILKDTEIERLRTDIPKIVVFAPLGFGVKRLLEQQVVQVAVVPRVGGGPPPPGGSPIEASPNRYEVLTPQSIATRPIFEPPLPPGLPPPK